MLNTLFTETDAQKIEQLIKKADTDFEQFRAKNRQELKESRARYYRTLQSHLVQMRDCKGYCALGYDSLHDWIVASLEGDFRKYERQIINADFHKEIFGEYLVPAKLIKRSEDKVEDVMSVAEFTSRPITALPREEWKPVWEIAKQIARTKVYPKQAAKFHDQKVTHQIAVEAVAEWKTRQNGLMPTLPVARKPITQMPLSFVIKTNNLLENVPIEYLDWMTSYVALRKACLLDQEAEDRAASGAAEDDEE